MSFDKCLHFSALLRQYWGMRGWGRTLLPDLRGTKHRETYLLKSLYVGRLTCLTIFERSFSVNPAYWVMREVSLLHLGAWGGVTVGDGG